MKPLQGIGLGLVFISLQANFGSYDGLPDPVGWVLILLGFYWLTQRTAIGYRMGLSYLGGLALLISAARWFPGPREAVADAEHAVVWAADLPALAFQVVLCHALIELAVAHKDLTPRTWLRICEIGLLSGIIAPVLYFSGMTWLKGFGDLGLLLQLVMLVLMFRYSGRPWAGPGMPRSKRGDDKAADTADDPADDAELPEKGIE